MHSPWLTPRQLAIVAIFSSLWAAVEVLVGTLLVMMNIPFRGAILTSIALGILVAVRKKVPKRGTAVVMAVIVAAIRLILGGPKILTIAPALVIEGTLIEAAFLLVPGDSARLNPARCIGAGILAVVYSFLHSILMVAILAGMRGEQFAVVINYVESFRFGLFSLWVALILLISAHALLGLIAGIASWRLTLRIQEPPA